MAHDADGSKNILLNGRIPGAVFLCLSGLGSGLSDLLPVAEAICKEGHTCELIHLPINATDDGVMAPVDPAAAVAQIEAAASAHRAHGYAIYLVGFSIGASLAILYTATHPCQGILAISAFFRPAFPRLSRLVLGWKKLLRQDSLKRMPQVTSRQTLSELDLSPRLPVRMAVSAMEAGQMAFDCVADVECPILFMHSFDDRVSHFGAVTEAVRRCQSGRSRLALFNHLNHYLQFDVPPTRFVRFALHSLGLPPPNGATRTMPLPADQVKIVSDLLKLYTEERRHWTLVLFQTMVGFFAAFSLLLYNSLSDVVTNTDKAPYYLISYSLAPSFYLTLTFLYFFYSNRVDAYIKFFVDPLVHGVSWAAFRTSKWMAGNESYRTTRLATIPLAVVPTLFSILSLIACVLRYRNKLFALNLDYAILRVLFVIAVGMSLYTLYAFVSHNRFTKRWLFSAHPPDKSDLETETLLFALYQSVSPGCVRQRRRS